MTSTSDSDLAIDVQESIDAGTIDVVYELSRDAFNRQFGEVHSIDDKLWKVLQAASVVAGVSGLSSAASQNAGNVIAVGFGLGALLSFGFLTGAVILGLRTRSWDPGFVPGEIWKHQWDQRPDAVRHAMIDRASEAYATNRALLDSKARSIRWAVWFLAIEVALAACSLGASQLGISVPPQWV